jgi:hypothetical protein
MADEEKKESKQLTKGLAVMQNKKLNKTQEKLEWTKEHFIVKGLSYTETIRAFAQHFGDTERNGKKYIEKIRKDLNKEGEDTGKFIYNLKVTIMRLNDLYQKAYDMEDWRECKNIQVEIAKYQGLDIKRVAMNVEQNNTTKNINLDMNQITSQLSPEQIKLMLDAMNKNKGGHNLLGN